MATAQKIVNERYSEEINIYNNYNPFRLRENVEPFMGGLPVIFVTTPSMNIFGNGDVLDTLANANPLFSYLADTDTFILNQLQYNGTGGGTKSPFIKILTNRFKGLMLKDFNMKTTEAYETSYGWKQILPSSINDNFTAESSLNISFAETKNLDITKIFYAWMCYIEAVRYGLHEPSQITRDNRMLDYTTSIYFFVLDFDMRTILYFCKYTGVYPVNVPLSNLVMSDITSRNAIDCSITFTYQYKEELNPQIIYDFNSVSNYTSSIFSYTKKDEDTSLSASTLKSKYGYGNFTQYKAGDDMDKFEKGQVIDGRDFLFNKYYDRVTIKTMTEGSYISSNQTAFNSAENNSKKTLVMCFDSSRVNNEKNDSGINYNETFSSRKYDSIKKSLIGSAKDLMGALAVGLISSASKSDYEKYEEAKKKELGIDDESIEKIKEDYKTKLDNEEITEDEYKEKIEALETKVKDKIEKNIMKYNDYKNSEEYMQAARLENYKKAVEQAAKTGISIAGSLSEYMASKMAGVTNKAIEGSERFLKYFGGFL